MLFLNLQTETHDLSFISEGSFYYLEPNPLINLFLIANAQKKMFILKMNWKAISLFGIAKCFVNLNFYMLPKQQCQQTSLR